MSGSARMAVEAYFAAINADRFAELAGVFAEDIAIHPVGAPPVTGREAALAHFPKLLADFTEHEDRVTRWIEAASDGSGPVVTEIDFAGRLRDGRPVAFSAVDVFDLRDGLITKIATWYDLGDVLRQVRRP